MKKSSITWCLFTLITGTLLGLLAGLGIAAPASADSGSATVADGPHDDDDDNRRDWDDRRDNDDRKDRWDDRHDDDDRRDNRRHHGDNDDAELAIERDGRRAVEVSGEEYEGDQRVTVYLVRNGHVVERERVWLDDDEEDFTVDFRDLRCGRYVAYTKSHEEGWVRSDDSVRICNRDHDRKH
ncbi:hypothetical protein [Crystallibacter degradans]|uniref:hypothetical protein n=1 Tax=Crystallibacter degradans TaxID=2726743 RepID=UPI00147586CB|nr:hypothetical protein [Arthrobacter sp. SF27]NMR31313.1 hypothetical protein [Arthrobacter sp. SF27]